MKIIKRLLVSHALFNFCAGQISHISHALPGRSSMSITRGYTMPSMLHNNHSLTSFFDNGNSMAGLFDMRYNKPSQTSVQFDMQSKPFTSYNIPSQPSYTMAPQSGSTYNLPSQFGSRFNMLSQNENIPNQSESSDSMSSQSGSIYNMPSQSGSSKNMPKQTGSSHSMPSQTENSYNMQSQSGSSYDMQSQPGSSYNIPIQSSNIYNIPTQSESSYNMQNLSGSSNSIPSQSGSSYNMPIQSESSFNMQSQSESSYNMPSQTGISFNNPLYRSNLLRPSKSSMSDMSGLSAPVSAGVPHPSQAAHPHPMYPMTAERDNVPSMSPDNVPSMSPDNVPSMSPDPDETLSNYDYQSLSRAQVDSHVFSVRPNISLDSIERDHSISQPDDSFHNGETNPVITTNMITHPVITTNMITHPVITTNMITHPVITTKMITHPVITSGTIRQPKKIDTSHRNKEEMIDYESPMLSRQQSIGPSLGGTPGPFAPRFQVPKWEISDSEWEEEIKEGFQNSGLIPGLIPQYPPGLVNINYGVHGCVHLGTVMEAETTSSPPSRVSFPAEPHKIYTLIFMDVNRLEVNWMVINIPGSAVRNGQTIAEYQPPSPLDTNTDNQYVAMALLQSAVINKRSVAGYSSKLCQYGPRTNFDLKLFMTNFGLEMIVAANYFVVHHNSYVESIEVYCRLYTGPHRQLSI